MDQEPKPTRPVGWSQRLSGGQPPQPPIPARGERFKLSDRIAIDGVTYKIERLLGEGASGRVFAASEVGTNRLVAIKEITFECVSPSPDEAVKKIRGEVHALQALDPLKLPGFPLPVGFEVDTQNERALIVIELIEGTPLDEQLATRRPLSEADIGDFIVIIGGALATLHRPPLLAWQHLPLDGNALVHGDIKPGNILATSKPDRPFVLVDFGTAAPTTHARHTSVHERLQRAHTTDEAEGTLPYADPHFATTRLHLPVSDVYSFAATILELCSPLSIADGLAARRLPLEATLDPRQGPLLQQLAMQAELDPKLRRVLVASLSLNPADRPQDLREFLHDLGEKRLGYWHRDRDSLIGVDLEWIEMFPEELRIHIQAYIGLIEETFTNPNFLLNRQIQTVPVFWDGATRDTIDSAGLHLWQRQVNLLRDRRRPLMEYWQQQTKTPGRSARSMSEFLTYTDALLTHQLERHLKDYYLHPDVTPDELTKIGVTVLPGEVLSLKSSLARTVYDEAQTLHLKKSGVVSRLEREMGAEKGYRVYLSTGQVLTVPMDLGRAQSTWSARARNFLGQEKKEEVREAIQTLRALQAYPELSDQTEDDKLVIRDADTVWRHVMTAVSAGNWGRAFALLDTHQALSELHSDHDQLLIRYANHLVRTQGYERAIRSIRQRPALTLTGKDQVAKLHDKYVLDYADWKSRHDGYRIAIQFLREEVGRMMTAYGQHAARAQLALWEGRQSR